MARQLLASYPVNDNVAVEYEEYEYVLPVGTVLPWPVATDPQFSSLEEEWHECDGTTLSETDYPEITSVLGTSTLPDYRGLFLRGYGYSTHQQINGTIYGTTSTLHLSGDVGETQGDAIRNIYGTLPCSGEYGGTMQSYFSGAFGWKTPASYIGKGSYYSTSASGGYFQASRVAATDVENRPVNTAVRYMIRIK